MLSPKSSPRGQLLNQYVLARIIRMDDVNVALFERDWHNTLYFFALNADEQIYLRYGGRDARSQDSYLNLESIELALKKGLDLHEQYKAGKLAAKPKPAAIYPKEYPLLVERTFARNQCVECHLIGDFQNLHREKDGTLDKLKHLYRAADVRTVGIELDVPKGLIVKSAEGAAATASIQAGDRISEWNGQAVWTFGDLQHAWDQLDRGSVELTAAVDRSGERKEVKILLPVRWWWTDVRWRQSSVDPRLYFEDEPLSAEEKQKLGLKADGFASRVKYVNAAAKLMKTHELQAGDIIRAVNGVESDAIANRAELYMRLKMMPGDEAQLDVLRDGEQRKMTLKSLRMAFRK